MAEGGITARKAEAVISAIRPPKPFVCLGLERIVSWLAARPSALTKDTGSFNFTSEQS
jgi:hypothetical protein